MYFVYRFIDKSKSVIYVGKSKQPLAQRFSAHRHLPDECYKMVKKIEYIECPTEADMAIREIYYINMYHNNPVFYNVLDNMGIPAQVSFNDKWKMYKESLPSYFSNSINYKKGYVNKTEIRYNKDGSIDKRKSNAKEGVSFTADSFTGEEVDLMVNYFIDEINSATNLNHEQIRFRNLVMFLLGVNLPLKSNVFLQLKYKNLFDENDLVKPLEITLNRTYKDENVQIPLPLEVQRLLFAYRVKYKLTYAKNAEDDLFESRNHQIINQVVFGRILQRAANSMSINKNISGESLRKTYGVNIYRLAEDKLSALIFIEKLFGYAQYGSIIKYLHLADEEVDYEYFFSNTFSLGKIDIARIACLKACEALIEEVFH